MAFGSFGQSQPSTGFSFGSTPAFGAASTPASSGAFGFGAASTPAFGASSTPAFGASTGGGFSFGSAPAFGAASSAPAFGASSTPAFGFGASTPAFGASSSTPGFGSSTPAFGSSTPAFGQAAPQPTLFGGGFGQQQPQQQQQQQVPFTRSSTFESLPKDTQNQLQQIQEQISKYEADRLKVQQLPHLQEAPSQQQGLDGEIAFVRGELKELSALIKAQEEGLQDFKEKSQQLLKAADVVVRTYKRNKEWRECMLRGDQVNLQKYLTLPVMLPGPYLEEAVQGMTETVGAYSKVLDEVEQVLASSSMQDPSQVDWRTVLPTIVSNMHDYFIAVAAKLEKTHSEVERLIPMHLARLREQGIYTDPFQRARRQEQLQQQQQQQRPAAAAASHQHAALPAGGASGALVPALPAPAPGGMFGAAQPTPAAPGLQAAPAFGSPFPAATPFGAGASPFGGATNSGLSRSASKPKSKKR